MHRHQGSCNVVNHQGQSTTERGCLQPGAEPLPDNLCFKSMRRKKEKRERGEEWQGSGRAEKNFNFNFLFWTEQYSLFICKQSLKMIYMNLGSFSAAGHCKYLTQALPIYSQRSRNPRVVIYAQCFFSSIQIKLLPRA